MPHRGSWHSSPPLISPPLLIILLPILALTLLFLAVPPILSAANNLLRPASVKTGWDSLNILLVVFAILCGVFARRNDDEPSPQSENDAVPNQNGAYRVEERVRGGGYGESQQQWFGFSEERKVYDATPTQLQSPATGVTRLRRSSSSYPDLRQWETGDDRYKFRFFDDYEIDKQIRSPARELFPATEQFRSPAREQFPAVERWPGNQEEHKEEVRVKEIPVDTFEIRPSPPKVESVSEITELDEREFTRIQSPPPAPPTPPPPPPSAKARSEHKHGKSERRKSNVKREIAMGLGKSKKIHSVSTPPPPPPPPPLTSSRRWSKLVNAGNQSPLIPVPPPPPPFKMAAMKFVVRGDYVKIRSNQSSRCSSPEREHIDVEVSETTTATATATTVVNAVIDHNSEVGGPVFCASPDVNVKAATFIARLRGEWRLEKLNSLKEKGNGSLPLGRGYSL
ncbi:putative transmembrane protein [Sesbania bispinosa]|nr:putative transmembrane protein [Sesbania bispinosa]